MVRFLNGEHYEFLQPTDYWAGIENRLGAGLTAMDLQRMAREMVSGGVGLILFEGGNVDDSVNLDCYRLETNAQAAARAARERAAMEEHELQALCGTARRLGYTIVKIER